MSKDNTQIKIEVLRNETQESGNTRGRVADIFNDLNNGKAEVDASNITDWQPWIDGVTGGVVVTPINDWNQATTLNIPSSRLVYDTMLDKTDDVVQSIVGEVRLEKGYLRFKDSATNDYVTLNVDESGFSVLNSDANVLFKYLENNTSKTISLGDGDGDVSTITAPQDPYNWTLPSKNGTFAMLSDLNSGDFIPITGTVTNKPITGNFTVSSTSWNIYRGTDFIRMNTDENSKTHIRLFASGSNFDIGDNNIILSSTSTILDSTTIRANNITDSTTFTKAVVRNTNGDLKTADVVEINSTDGTATKFANESDLDIAFPSAVNNFLVSCPNISTTNNPNGVVYIKTPIGWKYFKLGNVADV